MLHFWLTHHAFLLVLHSCLLDLQALLSNFMDTMIETGGGNSGKGGGDKDGLENSHVERLCVQTGADAS
jgi:hypothetical protein